MASSTKANFTRDRNMVLASTVGKMGRFIMVNSQMITEMVLVVTNGLTAVSIKDNGKMRE